MAFQKTNKAGLYLNRKGHKNEWEPDRLKHLGDYLQKMGLISEVTSLPDNLFAGLNQAIQTSGFWNANNDAEDTEMNKVGKGFYLPQTDAAEELGSAIQEFFDLQSFPITIAVNSIDPYAQKKDTKVKFPVGAGHKLYPNGLVVGAEQNIENGRFVMYIHLASVDETFNPADVNPALIADKISRIVRHELVHTQQFEKRRRQNKTSRMAAKKAYEVEGEIPPEDAPRDQYLGAGIEIDAYAHEFAEELLSTFGKKKAMQIVSSSFAPGSLEKMGVSDTLIEYLEQYNDASFTKKLRGKIYTQMTDMIRRGLYEGRNQTSEINVNGVNVKVEIANCSRSRRKGLMNRVVLDENAGMLFVFPDEAYRSFWMKETYLPLSIAYLDSRGTILSIEKMKPLSLDSVKSRGPARYALEMNEGWFEKNGILVGDTVAWTKNLQEKRMTESAIRKYIREMLRETFVSHSDEPLVGDYVVNNNPKCKHYGSEGIVLSIGSLDNDMGKTVVYKCTNNGDNWNSGDVLEKTMDQLVRK